MEIKVKAPASALGGGSSADMWWVFGAIGVVAAIFIVVGMLRQHPIGDVQPKTLRDDGIVKLVVTAGFALAWYLWEVPGVLN